MWWGEESQIKLLSRSSASGVSVSATQTSYEGSLVAMGLDLDHFVNDAIEVIVFKCRPAEADTQFPPII